MIQACQPPGSQSFNPNQCSCASVIEIREVGLVGEGQMIDKVLQCHRKPCNLRALNARAAYRREYSMWLHKGPSSGPAYKLAAKQQLRRASGQHLGIAYAASSHLACAV